MLTNQTIIHQHYLNYNSPPWLDEFKNTGTIVYLEQSSLRMEKTNTIGGNYSLNIWPMEVG